LNAIARRVGEIEHRLKHLNPIGKDERQECEEEIEAVDDGDPIVRSEVRRKIWKRAGR
jgi:hypothetical protein